MPGINDSWQSVDLALLLYRDDFPPGSSCKHTGYKSLASDGCHLAIGLQRRPKTFTSPWLDLFLPKINACHTLNCTLNWVVAAGIVHNSCVVKVVIYKHPCTESRGDVKLFFVFAWFLTAALMISSSASPHAKCLQLYCKWQVSTPPCAPPVAAAAATATAALVTASSSNAFPLAFKCSVLLCALSAGL